jgi:hypothetical protein
MGVIYADSSQLADAFDEASLDLIFALANSAAVALDQAHLLRRIRRVQRDEERLGRYLPARVVDRIVLTETPPMTSTSRPRKPRSRSARAVPKDFPATSRCSSSSAAYAAAAAV